MYEATYQNVNLSHQMPDSFPMRLFVFYLLYFIATKSFEKSTLRDFGQEFM